MAPKRRDGLFSPAFTGSATQEAAPEPSVAPDAVAEAPPTTDHQVCADDDDNCNPPHTTLQPGGPGGATADAKRGAVQNKKTVDVILVTALSPASITQVICECAINSSDAVSTPMIPMSYPELLQPEHASMYRMLYSYDPSKCQSSILKVHFKAEVYESKKLVDCNRWGKIQPRERIVRSPFPPAIVFYLSDKFDSSFALVSNGEALPGIAQRACLPILTRALLESNVPMPKVATFMTSAVFQFIEKDTLSIKHEWRVDAFRDALSIASSNGSSVAAIELAAMLCTVTSSIALSNSRFYVTGEALSPQCDVVELASIYLHVKGLDVFPLNFEEIMKKRLQKVSEKYPAANIAAFLLGFIETFPPSVSVNELITNDVRDSLMQFFPNQKRASKLLDSTATSLERCIKMSEDDPKRLETLVGRWLGQPASVITDEEYQWLVGFTGNTIDLTPENDALCVEKNSVPLAIRVPEIFCMLVIDRKKSPSVSTIATGRARVDLLLQLLRAADAINKQFADSPAALNNTIADRLSKHLSGEVLATVTKAIGELCGAEVEPFHRFMLELELRFQVADCIRTHRSLISSPGGSRPIAEGFGARSNKETSRRITVEGDRLTSLLPSAWTDNPLLFEARLHMLMGRRVPKTLLEEELTAAGEGIKRGSSEQRQNFRFVFKECLKDPTNLSAWSLWATAWGTDFKQSVAQAKSPPLDVALGIQHTGDIHNALSVLTNPTSASLFLEIVNLNDELPTGVNENKQKIEVKIQRYWDFFVAMWDRIRTYDLTTTQFELLKREEVFSGFKRINAKINVDETVRTLSDICTKATLLNDRKVAILKLMMTDRRYHDAASRLLRDVEAQHSVLSQTPLAKIKADLDEDPFAVAPEDHPLLRPHVVDRLLTSGVFNNVMDLVDHASAPAGPGTGGVNSQPLTRANFDTCVAEWRRGLIERYLPVYKQNWTSLMNGTMSVADALAVFTPRGSTLEESIRQLQHAAATGETARGESASAAHVVALRDRVVQHIEQWTEAEAQTARNALGDHSAVAIEAKACAKMIRQVTTAVLAADTLKYLVKCCERLITRLTPGIGRLAEIAKDLPALLTPTGTGALSVNARLSVKCGEVVEIFESLASTREGEALNKLCPGFTRIFHDLLEEGLGDLLALFVPDEDLRVGSTRQLEDFIEERSPEIDEENQAQLDHLLNVAKRMVTSSPEDTARLIKNRSASSGESLLTYLSLCCTSFSDAAQLRGNISEVMKLKTDTEGDVAIVNALRILTVGCFAVAINPTTEAVEVTGSFKTRQRVKHFDAEQLRDIGPNILLAGSKSLDEAADDGDDLDNEDEPSNLPATSDDDHKIDLKTPANRRKVAKRFVAVMTLLQDLVDVIETMRKVGHPNVNCLPLTVRSSGTGKSLVSTLDVEELIATLADEVEAWGRFTAFIATEIPSMNVISRRRIPIALQTAERVLTAIEEGNNEDKERGLRQLATLLGGVCFANISASDVEGAVLYDHDFLKDERRITEKLPKEMRAYPFTASAVKVAVLVEYFFNWEILQPHTKATSLIGTPRQGSPMPRIPLLNSRESFFIWRVENDRHSLDSSALLPMVSAVYVMERGRCPLPFETLLITELAEPSPLELSDFLSSWRRWGTMHTEPAISESSPPPLFSIINADMLPRHMQEQLVAELTDHHHHQQQRAGADRKPPPPLLLLTTQDCTIAHNLRHRETVIPRDGAGYKDLIAATTPLLQTLFEKTCTVVEAPNEAQAGKTRAIRAEVAARNMFYSVVSISSETTFELVVKELTAIHEGWLSCKSPPPLALHLDIGPRAKGAFVSELLFRWLYQGRFADKSGALCVWNTTGAWHLFVELPALTSHSHLHISTLAPFRHRNVLENFQFLSERYSLKRAVPGLFWVEGKDSAHAAFGSACLVAFVTAQLSGSMRMPPGDQIPMRTSRRALCEAIQQLVPRRGRSSQLRFFHLATHQLSCALGANTIYYSDWSAVDPVLATGSTMLAFHLCELICQCALNLTCDAIPPKQSTSDTEAARMGRMLGFAKWSREPFAIYNSDNDFKLFSLNDKERVLEAITAKNTNPLFRMFLSQQTNLRQMDRRDLQSHAQQASASENENSVFTILGITSTRPNLNRLVAWRAKLSALPRQMLLEDAATVHKELKEDLLSWFDPLSEALRSTHGSQQCGLQGRRTVKHLTDAIDRWWKAVFGTYNDESPPFVLTADLVVRLAAMKARLLSGVPVVWVGDQGCGKTYVCQAFARGSGCLHFTINCNGSVSAEQLLEALRPWIERAEASPEKLFLMQLDEFNTLADVWNAHQIICDRVLLGRFIPENILCMAIMNPTKVRSDEQRKAFEAVDTAGGFNYSEYAGNHSGSGDLADCAVASRVYDVNESPEALLSLAFDFGSAATTHTAREGFASKLTRWVSIPRQPNDVVADEIRFAESNVHWMVLNKLIAFEELSFDGLDNDYGFNPEMSAAGDAGGLRVHWVAFRTIVVSMMRASQAFLREAFKGETSVVSLRDMKKVTTILPFIFECCVARQSLDRDIPQTKFLAFHFLAIATQVAFVMTYHLRLDAKNRADYLERIHVAWVAAHDACRGLHDEFLAPPTNATEIYTHAFDGLAEYVVSCLTEQKDLVPNQALKENTIACIVAIKLDLTLFIVGRAGSSKTRSLQSLLDASEAARRVADGSRNFFREIDFDIVLQTLQCSRHTRARDVTRVVQGAARIQAAAARDNRKTKAVVVLEEAGATTGSAHNPFMSLHGIIDFGVTLRGDGGETVVRVPIIGVSNWQLGAQKMGRGNIVHRGNPPVEDLVKTGKFFLKGTVAWLEPVCTQFHDWILEGTDPTLSKFFGMRDMYTFFRALTALSRLDTNDVFGIGDAVSTRRHHKQSIVEAIQRQRHLVYWALVMAFGGLPSRHEALQNTLFAHMLACFPQEHSDLRDSGIVATWEHKGSIGGRRHLCDLCAYFAFLGAYRGHRERDDVQNGDGNGDQDPEAQRRHRAAFFRQHFSPLRQKCPCENFDHGAHSAGQVDTSAQELDSQALTAASADAQATRIIAYGLANTTMRHTLVFTKNVCTLRLLHKLGLAGPQDTIIVGEPGNDTGLAEQLRRVKECMARGEHLLIVGLHLTEILLEPLNMNYQAVGSGDAVTYFTRLPLADGRSKRVRINPSFRCTILCDDRNADRLLPPFIQRFTKVNLSFSAAMCPSQRDAMLDAQQDFALGGGGGDDNTAEALGSLLPLAIPGYTEESLASLCFLPGEPVARPRHVDPASEFVIAPSHDSSSDAKECFLLRDKIYNRLGLCLIPKVLAELDVCFSLDRVSREKLQHIVAASREPNAALYHSGNLADDLLRAWLPDVNGAPEDAPARHFFVMSEQADFMDLPLINHCIKTIEDGYADGDAPLDEVHIVGPHKTKGTIVELNDNVSDLDVALQRLKARELREDEAAIIVATMDCTRLSHHGAALATMLFHRVSAADLGERRHVFVFATVSNPLRAAKTLVDAPSTADLPFTLMFDPDWISLSVDTFTEAEYPDFPLPERLSTDEIRNLFLAILPSEAKKTGITELAQHLWLTTSRHPELFIQMSPSALLKVIGAFAESFLGRELLSVVAEKIVELEIFNNGTWPRLALRHFKDVEPTLRGLQLRFLTAVWYRAVIPLLEGFLVFGVLQRIADEDDDTVAFLEPLLAELERAPISQPFVSTGCLDTMLPLQSRVPHVASIHMILPSSPPWTPCYFSLMRSLDQLTDTCLDAFLGSAQDPASPMSIVGRAFAAVGDDAEKYFIEDLARTVLSSASEGALFAADHMPVIISLTSAVLRARCDEQAVVEAPLWLALLALYRFEPSALRLIFTVARDEKAAPAVLSWCEQQPDAIIDRSAFLGAVWTSYDFVFDTAEAVSTFEVLCRSLPAPPPESPTRGIQCADDPLTWRWHQLLSSVMETVATSRRDQTMIRNVCECLAGPASVSSGLLPLLRCGISPDAIQVLLSILLEWLPKNDEALTHLRECVCECSHPDASGPVLTALLRAAFIRWIELKYPPFAFGSMKAHDEWVTEAAFNVLFRELTRGDRLDLLLHLIDPSHADGPMLCDDEVCEEGEEEEDLGPRVCLRQVTAKAALRGALDILARSLRESFLSDRDDDTETEDADWGPFLSCTLNRDTNGTELLALCQGTQALLTALPTDAERDAAAVFFLRQASAGGMDLDTLRAACTDDADATVRAFVPAAIRASAAWIAAAADLTAAVPDEGAFDEFVGRYTPNFAFALRTCERAVTEQNGNTNVDALPLDTRVAAVLTLCAKQKLSAAHAKTLMPNHHGFMQAKVAFVMRPQNTPPAVLGLLIHFWAVTAASPQGSVLGWLHKNIATRTAALTIALPGVASSVEYDRIMTDPAVTNVYACPNNHKYGTSYCEHINSQGQCQYCGARIGGPRYGHLHPGNRRLGFKHELNESHFTPTVGWDGQFCRPIRNIAGAHHHMIRMLTLLAVMTRTIGGLTAATEPALPSLLRDVEGVLTTATTDLMARGRVAGTLRWMHAALAVTPLGRVGEPPFGSRDEVERAAVLALGVSPQTDATAAAEQRLGATVTLADMLLDSPKYAATKGSEACLQWLDTYRAPTTAAEMGALLRANPDSLAATLTRLHPSLTTASARHLTVFTRYLRAVQQTAAGQHLSAQDAAAMSLQDLFPHAQSLEAGFRVFAHATAAMCASVTQLNCVHTFRTDFQSTIQAFAEEDAGKVPLRALLPSNSDDGLFSQVVVFGSTDDQSRCAHVTAQNAVCDNYKRLVPAHAASHRTVAVAALHEEDLLHVDARRLIFDLLYQSFVDATGRRVVKVVAPTGAGFQLPDLCAAARVGLARIPSITSPLPPFQFSFDALGQFTLSLIDEAGALTQPLDTRPVRLIADMRRHDEQQAATDVMGFLALVAELHVMHGRALVPTLPLLTAHDAQAPMTTSQARGHAILLENQHPLAACQLQHLPALCAFLWQGPVAHPFSQPVEVPEDDLRECVTAVKALPEAQHSELLIAFRVAGLTQLRQSGEGRLAEAPLACVLAPFSELFDDNRIANLRLFQLPTKHYAAVRALLDRDLPLTVLGAGQGAGENEKASLASVFRCPKRRRLRQIDAASTVDPAMADGPSVNPGAIGLGGLQLGSLPLMTVEAANSPPLTARTAFLRQQQQQRGGGTCAISWARRPQFATYQQ